MNVKALGIYWGRELRVGVLFQYALEGAATINRFEVDARFRELPDPPTLSLAFLAATPQQQQALWSQVTAQPFNARHTPTQGWTLPSFFQNLLPEGVFRDHVAALRRCDPRDHFEMLAACGKDLPGNLYALPVELSRDELAHYVTQDQDALEMSVTAEPLEEGVSLSGVQPKLGVIREGGRYVGRTRDQDTHIIAKLPVVGQPLLPEVEELSLRLARAAGVDTCEAYLEPLGKLAAQHRYDLGDADARTHFLAVVRYDRGPQGRTHCEDFAQVLGALPDEKYTGADPRRPASYLGVAAVLLGEPSMGETAVHELLRRLMVNELLGNADGHLKNLGLRYPDAVHPQLAPAYDIVAYAVYSRATGHALRIVPDALAPRPKPAPEPGRAGPKQSLSPAMVRAFCTALGLPEKPAMAAVTACVRAAHARWPAMIETSALTALQKRRLAAHFHAHPMIASLDRRSARSASPG
ncbi:MAG: type II toxin-antitoxin system HipA family toxin [Comamonadaceae bacterium]|nr:MAG: type II toxin-antitoxin system HipA family toxin [Comamonadaceae bacterium]